MSKKHKYECGCDSCESCHEEILTELKNKDLEIKAVKDAHESNLRRWEVHEQQFVTTREKALQDKLFLQGRVISSILKELHTIENEQILGGDPLQVRTEYENLLVTTLRLYAHDAYVRAQEILEGK